jgi:hypothetical protein
MNKENDFAMPGLRVFCTWGNNYLSVALPRGSVPLGYFFARVPLAWRKGKSGEFEVGKQNATRTTLCTLSKIADCESEEGGIARGGMITSCPLKLRCKSISIYNPTSHYASDILSVLPRIYISSREQSYFFRPQGPLVLNAIRWRNLRFNHLYPGKAREAFAEIRNVVFFLLGGHVGSSLQGPTG